MNTRRMIPAPPPARSAPQAGPPPSPPVPIEHPELDPNPALRAELLAALAVLAPQIRGLLDLAVATIPDDLRAEIQDQIALRTRRHDRIQAVLDQLDIVITARMALRADGYPLLPPVQLPDTKFQELQDELAELLAAIAIFQAAHHPETGDFNPERSTET